MKKPLGTLQPIDVTVERPKTKAEPGTRGSVQTVRMDRETLRALKMASMDRGISQNDIMLTALRRDLGLG